MGQARRGECLASRDGGGDCQGGCLSNARFLTTTWNLNPSRKNLHLYAYFASAAAALTNGSTNIPSSRVLGSANGGPFSTFTSNSPFGAADSLQVFTIPILGSNKKSARTDSLQLKIDTTGLLLPAGSYTGLLNLQAQAL